MQQRLPPVAVLLLGENLGVDLAHHEVELLLLGGDVSVQPHRAGVLPGGDLAQRHRFQPDLLGQRDGGSDDARVRGDDGDPIRVVTPGQRVSFMPAPPTTSDRWTSRITDVHRFGVVVGHRSRPADVDQLWQAVLRGFDREHIFRRFKEPPRLDRTSDPQP
ncbi:glycoside hydrolase 64/thaumatin family protein [Nonomuraea jabiensis]|uniref:hypothetical protein n=1 Tax=Nonomuraea jabiensis TaxID=882448 RepID=UPI0036C2DB59